MKKATVIFSLITGLFFLSCNLFAQAQKHMVAMISELKNNNCPTCSNCILTQTMTGSLKEAQTTANSLRREHGMIPSIYTLKPAEGAVIYEFDKVVGNCRCTIIRIMTAGKTAEDAMEALNQEKKRNPELREKTISIRETWPVDIMETKNKNN